MPPERGLVRAIDGTLLRELPHENVTIRDTVLRGFQIRVRYSARCGLTASYRVQLRRGQAVTLGRVGVLQLKEAREVARKKLAAVALKLDVEPVDAPPTPTLRTYIAETYGPWIEAHAKTGNYIHSRLTHVFKDLLDLPLDKVTAWNFEQWRTARRREGTKGTTINRDLQDIRALYSRAVKWGHVGKSPLVGVPRDKVDQQGIIRFLSPEEEARLRKALSARDEFLRKGRESANKFRRDRGYPEFPPHGVYPDHLTPIVLLAVNTGLRFGEIVQLRWADVLLGAAPPRLTGTWDDREERADAPRRVEPAGRRGIAGLETEDGWSDGAGLSRPSRRAAGRHQDRVDAGPTVREDRQVPIPRSATHVREQARDARR